MKLKILLTKLAPILFLLLISLAFFHPVWLQGKVPLPGDFVVGVYYPWLDYKWGYEVGVPVKNPMTTDVVSFTYPMQMLAVDLMKRGEWPLWNPYILGGTPLLANFQSAPFSPTNFVYFLFDRLTAWSLQVTLQHILAALFAFILLKHWKVSNFAAVFGAVIFAFSGFNLLWSQWNGHTLAAAFIPLILFFEDKYLVEGKVKFGIGLSITLALQVLSGYPQVMFYSAVAIGILWIFRFQRLKGWFVKTLMLGIFSVLGFGLSAFQILPGAELLSLSQREVEPHPYEWAFLPFEKVITFFAPDYFGNHATQNYWGPQDYTSNTGFVGVAAAILAGFAIKLFKKHKEVKFVFTLLIVALILAFPSPVSIFLWKSGIFGLNAASAHRALILFNLSVAILGGFGVQYFLNNKKLSLKLPFIIPGITVLGFALFALIFFFLSQNNPDAFSQTAHGIPKYVVALRNSVVPIGVFFASFLIIFLIHNRNDALKKLGLATLFIIMTFELFRFGWKFTPFVPRHIVFPETPILKFLKERENPFRTTGSRVIPINMRMPYKIESLEGYDAVYPLVISQFIAAVNSQKSGTDPVGRYGTIDNFTSPLMDLVNTRYYLALKKDEKNVPSPKGRVSEVFEEGKFREVFEDRSVAILESNKVLPRGFMVYQWEVIQDDNKILDRLLGPDFQLDKRILLNEDIPIKSSSSLTTQSDVEYLSYKEQQSKLKVKTEVDSVLFVSDTFYPGWKAYVDGVETKIYRANFAFRAIFVPEGDHEIVFSYEPESFYNGLKISGVSSLIVIILLFFSFLGKTRFKRYT